MKLAFVLLFSLLFLNQMSITASATRDNGRQIIQTRIDTIDRFERLGTTIFGSVYEISLTAEYWNPKPDTVYITHESDCNDQILVTANFLNASLLYQPQPLICDDAISEFAYATGVDQKEYSYTFSISNYFNQSLPDGSITISYNLGQVAEHTYNSTIVISNGEWQAVHDVYAENWGELPDTLVGFIIWGVYGMLAFVVFLVIRAKPWKKKDPAT